MLAELQRYYESNGISALDFACCHHTECSKQSPGFTQAKEAFVSTGYERHTLPRLLFLSLDSGSCDQCPAMRTMGALREQESKTDVCRLPKARHWYRTHELAQIILSAFQPGLHIEAAKQYFAHTNSAKCCANNPGRAKGSAGMFRNCRGYIRGEVAILRPDIIVTQGAEAHRSIEGAFPERDMPLDGSLLTAEPQRPMVVVINDAPVLWFRSYHPRNYGRFNKQRTQDYPQYPRLARSFMASSGRWPGPCEAHPQREA